MDTGLRSIDPLRFAAKKKYRDSLADAEKKTGSASGVASGIGDLAGRRVSMGVMDFRFIGGSMGSVEGEKIARVFRKALEMRIPAVVVSASGGARMQEGALSLMQMANTSACIAQLREARLPYISVFTNPTMGGVTASFAMLGDVHLAEPGALIGFAGERVIRETIRQALPSGFQRAEFTLEKGFIDLIVARPALKDTLARILGHLCEPG
jgi:acetyl-CoA carboxylase carboxyl transferase subunit beta